MRRKILTLCLLFPLFLGAGDPILDNIKSRVEGIYQKVNKTVDDREERLSMNDYINMYGRDKNGDPIYTSVQYPNDIYLLNGNIGDKSVEPETYFGDIEEFVNNNNVDFDWEVVDANYCKQPELVKNEDDHRYAEVKVQKRWTVNGNVFVINDVVTVDLRYNYVALIYSDVISLLDCPEVTLDGMMAKAAGLYNSKNYIEAAALYQKILEEYPNNDDAWYNLGVMYYKKQGVGKLTNRQRLEKAYDCWKKSNLKKARRAISYITDGRE